MSKKDKSEPKTLTITPSEKTHFRVILSTEAMEEPRSKTDPVCDIIKPEPRTVRPDRPDLTTQPLEASPCPTNVSSHQPELSDSASGAFTSDPCPGNAQVGAKCARKTKWTSSPPNRRDSDAKAGPPTADPRAADSPGNRRGNARVACARTATDG